MKMSNLVRFEVKDKLVALLAKDVGTLFVKLGEYTANEQRIIDDLMFSVKAHYKVENSVLLSFPAIMEVKRAYK